MSNPAFIRGLFGELNGWRYDKIQADISRALTIDSELDFTCYTFGTDNHNYLRSLGVDSVLMNPKPILDYKYVWRHKLDIYTAAMKDYDEIVYLDWDCNLTSPLPSDFWNKLRLKNPIQGCLYKWNKSCCLWRSRENQGYLINNGFLYFGNRYIPQYLIELYDGLPNSHKWKRNDETVTSYYIDSLTGWKSKDYWLKKYEPECCQHVHGIFKKSNPVFTHYKTSMEKGVYKVYA